MQTNRGIWLAVFGGTAMAAASVLVIFLIWGFSGKIVAASYIKPNVRFFGNQDLFHPALFLGVGTNWHAAPVVTPESSMFRIHWKHVPYRVDSLTTSVLASLGFEVTPPFGLIGGTTAKHKTSDGKNICSIGFSFEMWGPIFRATCSPDHGHSCPFGFSYGSSGEMRLPVTMEDLHRVFGKPDKMYTRPDPWLKKWFYWQFPSFAPPPMVP